MGQEWAASTPFCYFTDHGATLGREITKGRRAEFAAFAAFADPEVRESIPDPQDERTFEMSRLNWSELEEIEHQRVLRLYTTLLALRRREPAFAAAAREDVAAVAIDDVTIALWRVPANVAPILVVARLVGAGTVEVPIDSGHADRPINPGAQDSRNWSIVLTTEDAEFAEGVEKPRVEVNASALRVMFARAGAIVLRG
jgi:maltooligosyltrehalose trehalohydrolase